MKNPGQENHYRQENPSNNNFKKQYLSSRYKLFLFLLLLFILAAVFLQVYQYVQLSRKNIELEELKEERNSLKTDTAYLRLEISRLMSLERIERIARKELGMERPEEVNYITINSNEEEKD